MDIDEPVHGASGPSLPADPQRPLEPAHRSIGAVGFFPGLGSRAAYRHLDRDLSGCEIEEVRQVYEEAAHALGYGSAPGRMVLSQANLPADRVERQAFLGAALLVHGIALHRYLGSVDDGGCAFRFVAFAGESFGIITAAVAGGALSLADGVKIAHALSPFILVGAEGATSSSRMQVRVADALAAAGVARPLAPRPAHVVALKGRPEAIGCAMEAVGDNYDLSQVELHKRYAADQVNLYVQPEVWESFRFFTANFPDVALKELKEPTTFMAHAARMAPVRAAFARMMRDEGISFRNAHTPVVCNHANRVVYRAADVRDAVLSIIDRVMESRWTATNCQHVGAGAVIELGQGGKSVQLLADNEIVLPVIAYAGSREDTDALSAALLLLKQVHTLAARPGSDRTMLGNADLAVLRRMFGIPKRYPLVGELLADQFTRLVADLQLGSRQALPPSVRRFLEIYQHTSAAKDDLDLAAGELAIQLQAKKTVVGDSDVLGRVKTEIWVLRPDGSVVERCSTGRWTPEALVFSFSRLNGMSVADLVQGAKHMLEHYPQIGALYERLADVLTPGSTAETGDRGSTYLMSPRRIATLQILHQVALLTLLKARRPAIFMSHDYYFAGSDVLGWCVALCAADALDVEDAVSVYTDHLHRGAETAAAAGGGLDDVLERLRETDAPLVSAAGFPLTSVKDVAAATREAFKQAAFGKRKRYLRLNGDVQVVCLGSHPPQQELDAFPFEAVTTVVAAPEEIARRSRNAALDALEHGCLSTVTDDNQRVLSFARGRKVLSSTVFSYIKIGERVLGFGKGGSESMTMFITSEDPHAA